MREPIWVEKKETLASYLVLLAEHGSVGGLRDEGLLESALARAKNIFAYEHNVGLPRLAAAYAYGISSNHPFVDGNKRMALVVAEGFLRFNGHRIESTKEEKYRVYLQLAAGQLTEPELAKWFAEHMVAL